ncbi:hypothetical protein BDF22DRAFT_662886 [Syncephalis plumigaleata]|nr:hypothetical protein BDF22DRAFT_662886 [Syncephalis plumigaleata]
MTNSSNDTSSLSSTSTTSVTNNETATTATTKPDTDTGAAYNEETGEINWDCPCLGGMAEGPCGEEFKTAFSCFVYSEAEPKGIDCVDAFKLMQDCSIYADELADDDDVASKELEGLEGLEEEFWARDETSRLDEEARQLLLEETAPR